MRHPPESRGQQTCTKTIARIARFGIRIPTPPLPPLLIERLLAKHGEFSVLQLGYSQD